MNLSYTFDLFLATLVQKNEVTDESEVEQYVGHPNNC